MARKAEGRGKVRAELEGVLLTLADMKECAPIVRLRIQQGIRRSGLKDLLHPALEDLDRMMADVNDAQSQVHAAMQRLME